MDQSNDGQIDDNVKKQEYIQSLDTYYRLKNEYDTNVSQIKSRISSNKRLTVKEKQEAFRDMSSAVRCINCNRVGGTDFQEFYDKEKDGRVITAKCGVKVSPCILDIEINIGAMENISEGLTNTQTQLNDKKHEIMRIKNDVLFGYKEMDADLTKNVTEIQDELKGLLEEYESRLELYVAMYDRPQDEEPMRALELDIYNSIQSIRVLMNDYGREKNTQLVRDAVSVMITEVAPKTAMLRNIKYGVVETQTDAKTNTCVLTERRIAVESTEFDMSISGTEVVKMVTGVSMKNVPRKKNDSKSRVKDETEDSSSEYKLSVDSGSDSSQPREEEMGVINLDDEAIQL